MTRPTMMGVTADVNQDHVEIHCKQCPRSVGKLLGYYEERQSVWWLFGVVERAVVKKHRLYVLLRCGMQKMNVAISLRWLISQTVLLVLNCG